MDNQTYFTNIILENSNFSSIKDFKILLNEYFSLVKYEKNIQNSKEWKTPPAAELSFHQARRPLSLAKQQTNV